MANPILKPRQNKGNNMLKKILTALLISCSLTCVACAEKASDEEKNIRNALPRKASATPKGTRKVLIFSKTAGFRHGSIATGALALTLLGEQTGAYTAVHSEDDSQFEPDTLKGYDAVIMLNTTGKLFASKEEGREERLKQSLVDFVKSGGGLVGMHSATDTYKDWKTYNDMMGGAFDGHPWHQDVPIKNLAPKNTINLDLEGAGFLVKDEIYQFRKDTAQASDRKMLLALDNDKLDLSKGKYGKDALYPISWIDTYEKGRIYYNSLGHRNEIYWNPGVLQHYLRGIQYAMGDLDADATP
jgi:type 1 glutamine amidotransferase